MSTNDGGQAFPRTGTLYPDGVVWDAGSDGMTLRDYFAAKALQGVLATHPPASELGTFVQYAYRIADAMLKAREAA